MADIVLYRGAFGNDVFLTNTVSNIQLPTYLVPHTYVAVGGMHVTNWVPVVAVPLAGLSNVYVREGSTSINGWGYVVGTATSAVNTGINPGAGSVTITGYAPTIATTANQSLIPGNGALSLTGYAPTLAQTANASLMPGAGALSITGYAPSIAQTSSASYGLVSEYRNTGPLSVSSWFADGLGTPAGMVAPGVGSLTITGYAPTVTQAALPVGMNLDYRSQGSLKVNQWAYTVSTSVGIVSEYRNLGSLSATSWFADGISVPVSSPSLIPGNGSLTITGYAPSVSQSSAASIVPGAGTLTLTGYAPSVAQSVNQAVIPGNGALNITGFAPSIAQTTLNNINPGNGSLTITGYAPTVVNSGVVVNTGGGGYGDKKPKKRYIVERNGQLLVFSSATEAANAIPSTPKKVSKKRVKAPIPAVQPEVVIDLPKVQEYAQVVGQIDDYNAAYNSQHFEALIAMFEQMQEEDDMETLLMLL